MLALLALLAGFATASGSDAAAASEVPSAYWDPAWSPDGRQIAFVDREGGVGHGDLWIANADGSGVHRVTRSTGGDNSRSARYPTWSADGGRIAFGYGYDGIYVVDTDGTSLLRIATGCCPDWSARGRRIAYALPSETDQAEIFVIRPDGTGKTLVARPKAECESFSMPTWSPDGEQLAFNVGGASDCDPGASPYVGIIKSYRGRVRSVARGAYAAEPDWSPDNRRLVYAEPSGTSWMITVLDLKTGKRTKLRRGWHPRWSPNGRLIAYSAGGKGIYTMRPDGSHVTRLLPRS
jgi:TolB protein